MWRDFDLGEVRDEMAQISCIGFDVVRALHVSTDDYYLAPATHFERLYARWPFGDQS